MTNNDTTIEEKGMGIKNEADPFYDGCPCDFHSRQLTNEDTRITLFRPMDDGSKPSALVMVERFWHMQDAHYRALDQKLKEGMEKRDKWKLLFETLAEAVREEIPFAGEDSDGNCAKCQGFKPCALCIATFDTPLEAQEAIENNF